jgi:hypothetical protein
MSQPLRRGLRARGAAPAPADDSRDRGERGQGKGPDEPRGASGGSKRKRASGGRAQQPQQAVVPKTAGGQGGRGPLLAQLRREASYRAMCDQAVMQSALAALCTLRAAGHLDLSRLRAVVRWVRGCGRQGAVDWVGRAMCGGFGAVLRLEPSLSLLFGWPGCGHGRALWVPWPMIWRRWAGAAKAMPRVCVCVFSMIPFCIR